GYGLVYTNVTNIVPRTEVSSLRQASINLTGNVPYPDPYQGRDPAAFVSTSPPNINIIADNLVNAPVHTSSVGFSQQLMSDVGVGIGGVITDNYNPGFDVGPSNADRRHELVVSGGGQLPAKIVVGAIWNLRTSYPFSAKAGVDLNSDGALTDYVPGTTKNMGNRNTAAMLVAVNAYRAALGLAPFSASQIDSS